MGSTVILRAYPAAAGWIEVVTGCMFSGKTEELIRRLNRARYATDRVVMFKPAIDTRFAVGDVVSHSNFRFPCTPVQTAAEIARLAGDALVVGIDEAQFFDDTLVKVADHLAEQGKRVIIAGLDQDYRGIPFDPIPHLLAIAEYITKTHAVCLVCGSPATRSQRMVQRDARVVIGATEAYEARCRLHWQPDAFDTQQEALPLRTDKG